MPVGQLFLNARGVCGSRGGYIPIERRGGDTEAVRDLSYGNVRISKQRLGGLDIILGEFRGTASGAAKPPRGGETRLGALTDQTTLEFRQRAEHVKNQPALRSRRVEGFG